MRKVRPTEHFKGQVERLYSNELGTWQHAYNLVLSKMKHRRIGVHWVLLKRLKHDITLARKDTRDKFVNGDVLIAVVRHDSKNPGNLVLTTVFVRRERQHKKCRYYWR